MKFAAFQPYFFPYLGHFHLINSVDLWVVSDELQHIQYGWINRNRILHPAGGWTYIIVPLKAHPHTMRIKDVQIVESDDWKRRILGQLGHYRRHAPHYISTLRLVESCLENETHSIAELNTAILAMTCQHLGIRFEYQIASELGISRRPGISVSELICLLASRLGAGEYINPLGGAHLYNEQILAASGVKLTFQKYTSMRYATPGYAFEPELSIIDVLMWNSVSEIRHHLELDGAMPPDGIDGNNQPIN